MGNIVFLHEKGAAAFFEDHPLDPFYIFTTLEALNGSLLSRVQDALKQPSKHLKQQSFYRRRIRLERKEFDLQVESIFGSS